MIYEYIRLEREYAKIINALDAEYPSKRKRHLYISGLCAGASDSLLCAICDEQKKKERALPFLVLCGNEKEGERLSAILGEAGLRMPLYRSREFVFSNISASHGDDCRRLEILYGLLSGFFDGAVTTPSALLQFTAPPDVLRDSGLCLSVGGEVSPDRLTEQLLYLGYAGTEMVDCAGQFSRRGGIVDIFLPFTENGGTEKALRVEFFGDEIDRMGWFDPDTQRVTDRADAVRVPAVREVLYGDEERQKIREAIRSLARREGDPDRKASLSAELAAADAAQIPYADKYISLVYERPASLLDYIGENGTVVMVGTNTVSGQLDASLTIDTETVKQLIEERRVSGKYAVYSYDRDKYTLFLETHATVHLDSFLSGSGSGSGSLVFGLRTRQTASGGNMEFLKEDLENYVRSQYRILLGTQNSAEAGTLSQMLRDADFAVADTFAVPPSPEELAPRVVYIVHASATEGYELGAARFAYISYADRGTKKTSVLRRGKRKRFKEGQKLTSYADLTVGDYVVHESYGIGIYRGLTTITSADGVTQEYISIQYAGADKLFIPVHRLEQISKYIGAHSDDGLLKLSKMGGTEWKRQTARTRAAVREMAKELIDLYARRMRQKGYAFPPDDALQEEFDSSFMFEETDSQLEAIDEIKHDMMRAIPMDRLLCGDVGYGKTEVAFRAAFKAIEAGKQVALLCPTTILAYQHFQTALARFSGFPIRIEMISRFRSQREQTEILRRLKRGDVDMIIGTHKLVYGEIEFKDLGLLIVDEEQRFGVAQKEKLKKFATDVDVLSLSATPIPRTLNMAMGGIRDMSVLDEAPEDRMPVQTYVMEYDAAVIEEAIRRELSRGGQVFYLYNRIETINQVAARISDAIESATIAVAHGQMDRDEIEKIWEQVAAGNVDVLVCTSIIETGIDVPNANTLIIENADTMGLSQLHQLRGRVGRSSRRAYAYFTYRRGKVLTEIAEKRLRAICEYAEFGAGFRIALRDLEIRGAGNLLGAEQHGHMDAVGYDMYIRLLNEAVLEEKGEKPPQKTECKIDLSVDAYIPDSYIASQALRMEQYRRIAMILYHADVDDIADELTDRYGDYPPQVANLLLIAELKAMCERCGLVRVVQSEGTVSFYPAQMKFEYWSAMKTETDYKMRIVIAGEPHLTVRIPHGYDALECAVEVVRAYAVTLRESTEGTDGASDKNSTGEEKKAE